MRKLLSRPLLWLIGAILLVSASFFFWISGSVIVIDETQGVQSVVVTNNRGTEQKLYELWGGFFYTIPQMEGTIEVHCQDGTRKHGGYVTTLLDTKLKILGKTPCESMIYAE